MMDIFSTVLTRVRTTPIKPEQLKVKSLKKEAATKDLSDDIDHLEDHDLYFVQGEHAQDEPRKDPPSKESSAQDKQSLKQQLTNEGSQTQAIKPDILHKQDIVHPKKHHQEDDDSPHLDLYI